MVRHCSRPRPAKDPPRVCARLRRAPAALRAGPVLGRAGSVTRTGPFVAGREPGRPACRARRTGWAISSPISRPRHAPCPGLHHDHRAGRLLEDGQPGHPQALLERARRRGRSMGSLARALEALLHHPRPGDAHRPGRTARRRAAAAPHRRRPRAAAPGRGRAFAGSCSGPGSAPAGPAPGPGRTSTIETALATVRDLGRFLAAERGKRDWALADVHDIEAFLATLPTAANAG